MAAVIASAIAVAGCGSSSSAAGSSAGKPASFVPAGTPVYIEASTDPGSSQWQQAITLAKRFPGYPELQTRLSAAMGKEGIDFERDVRPLLGSAAAVGVSDLRSGSDAAKSASAVGVLELASGKEADFLALIQRHSTGRASLEKLGSHGGVDYYGSADDPARLAVTDGTVVIASDQTHLFAALDAHAAGGDRTLASSRKLEDLFAKLPSDVLVQGFVDVGSLGHKLGERSRILSQLPLGNISPDAALAFSVSAESNGVRLKGVTSGIADRTGGAAEFTPSLTSHVPSDAIAYLGLHDLSSTVAAILDEVSKQSPQTKQQLDQVASQVEPMLGVSLGDLSALGEGEHAIVVTKGAPIPSVVAVLEQGDGARAKATLDKLRERSPALAAQLGRGQKLDWRSIALANGVQGWQAAITPQAGLVYGVDGKLALIGTLPDGVRSVQAPLTPLSESAAFQQATRQMPSKVAAVLWLNVEELLPTLNATGALKGADPRLVANLRPVKNVAAWATGGDDPTFELFATIE